MLVAHVPQVLSTGVNVVIGNGIQVTFTSITGAARRHIFHTCGNALELSSTYDDFCHFRKEFTSIILHQDVEMDLVLMKLTFMNFKVAFFIYLA